MQFAIASSNSGPLTLAIGLCQISLGMCNSSAWIHEAACLAVRVGSIVILASDAGERGAFLLRCITL